MTNKLNELDWVIDITGHQNNGQKMQVVQSSDDKTEVTYFVGEEQEHKFAWVLTSSLKKI